MVFNVYTIVESTEGGNMRFEINKSIKNSHVHVRYFKSVKMNSFFVIIYLFIILHSTKSCSVILNTV